MLIWRASGQDARLFTLNRGRSAEIIVRCRLEEKRHEDYRRRSSCFACIDKSCPDLITFRPWMPMQERVHMLNKICLWILAILAFVCLVPLLAYAVSEHSDFGVSLAEILKRG